MRFQNRLGIHNFDNLYNSVFVKVSSDYTQPKLIVQEQNNAVPLLIGPICAAALQFEYDSPNLWFVTKAGSARFGPS